MSPAMPRRRSSRSTVERGHRAAGRTARPKPRPPADTGRSRNGAPARPPSDGAWARRPVVEEPLDPARRGEAMRSRVLSRWQELERAGVLTARQADVCGQLDWLFRIRDAGGRPATIGLDRLGGGGGDALDPAARAAAACRRLDAARSAVAAVPGGWAVIEGVIVAEMSLTALAVRHGGRRAVALAVVKAVLRAALDRIAAQWRVPGG